MVRAALVLLAAQLSVPGQGFNVQYYMAYDTVTGITTLSNTATSEGALPFFTLTGPATGYLLGLPPGQAVDIYSNGNIYVGDPGLWDWLKNLFTPPCGNAKTNTKAGFTITGGTGVVDVDGNAQSIFPGDTITVGVGSTYKIRGQGITTSGCDVTTLTTNTEVWYNIGTDMPLPLDQVQMHLVSGTVYASDNTADWVSIFTGDPVVVTGCPEPSTFGLLGLSALALGACGRRRPRTKP